MKLNIGLLNMNKYFIFLILFLISFSFISAGELRVTEEHPFLINGSWIDASELKVGDELTLSNGSKVTITKLTDVETENPFKVYNLEAGLYHNFVVGKERVVVHNSNKGSYQYTDGSFCSGVCPSCNAKICGGLSADSGKITLVDLETLLLRPAGNPYAAKVQAIAVREMKPGINTYAQDLKIAIASQVSSSNPPGSAFQTKSDNLLNLLDEYRAVNKDLSSVLSGNPSVSRKRFRLTICDEYSRFKQVYNSADKYIFRGVSTSTYQRTYRYNILKSGRTEEVRVIHTLMKDPGSVTFRAEGGVLNSRGESSWDDLLLLLDQLRNKALTAPTREAKAVAIAEWEWVHAVTSPSIRGGGEILMQLDYALIERAGFAITEKSYRRLELELLSKPHDIAVAERSAELLQRFYSP
jgi:hypothetical protein